MPSGWRKTGELRVRKRKQICDVLAEKGMERHWLDRVEGLLGMRRHQ